MQLVDTNVLVYLLIEGDRTAAARELHAQDPDWRSDGFLLIEFANVMSTYVRARALGVEQGLSMLREAERRVSLLPHELFDHATVLTLATRSGISAYDARFIAAAQQLGVRLVTEDSALRTAVPQHTRSLQEAIGRSS